MNNLRIQHTTNFQPRTPRKKARKDPNAPFIREKLELPEGHNKLLLHSCCAPCSGEVMEAIITLLLAVEADVLSYLICKWLDGYIQGGK